MNRCPWASSHPLMRRYHDEEWGVPEHDDRRLFEMLILEAAQAGLSWLTVLQRRDAYRRVFRRFDIPTVAGFRTAKVEEMLTGDSGIIRNRLKIEGAVRTAQVVTAVRAEAGSLDKYVWTFVGGRPIRNCWREQHEIPGRTAESTALSKDLVRRGATFVGPTICYAFMQACGLVNDHLVTCFRYRQVSG